MVEMISELSRRQVNLEWIGDEPGEDKRCALLIPQFNESSNGKMLERLEYFKDLAFKYGSLLDVIVIDDGSTDDSLRLMEEFMACNPGAFLIASVYPNAQKVGALFLAASSITHEFVILSDFDTDLEGLPRVIDWLDELNKDPFLMGCYFRMLPFEGTGNVFIFQQMEYSFLRIYYRFHEAEGSVPVMPGAGSCYKRSVLLDLYQLHSGLRNGEDREATFIGLRMGYRTDYMKEVVALTRPPLSFKALIRQRKRWNLGYLETFIKEREYYLEEIRKLSKIGLRTLLDFTGVAIILLLPFAAIIFLMIDPLLTIKFIAITYLISLSYYLLLLMGVYGEMKEIKRTRLVLVVLYPFFWQLVSFISWLGAFIQNSKKKKRKEPAGDRPRRKRYQVIE